MPLWCTSDSLGVSLEGRVGVGWVVVEGVVAVNACSTITTSDSVIVRLENGQPHSGLWERLLLPIAVSNRERELKRGISGSR
jgi:hypothetical protein